MVFVSVLWVTLISTVCMTVISIVLTFILKNNLIEPYWLNTVLFKKKQNLFIPGWILHYITGIGFLYLLHFILPFLGDHLILNALISGIIEGILGIVLWHILFKITFKPHDIKLIYYYPNLVLAHIVFNYVAISMM